MLVFLSFLENDLYLNDGSYLWSDLFVFDVLGGHVMAQDCFCCPYFNDHS